MFREKPTCHGDEYTREHTQINRKSIYGRCIRLSCKRVSYADQGLVEKCYILAVADCMPWATFIVLIGRDVKVMKYHMVTYI